MKLNFYLKFKTHHINIKNLWFNINWFEEFNFVFNALDNFKVKKYVIKMCLTANVPLIRSGTTGCNSQVQIIFKINFLEILSGEIPHKYVQNKTECYNCNTKKVLKRFPVCTVCDISSQPIHYIIWVKSYLLTEVFSIEEDDPAVFNHFKDFNDAAEIENLCKKINTLKQIQQSINQQNFLKKYLRRSL